MSSATILTTRLLLTDLMRSLDGPARIDNSPTLSLDLNVAHAFSSFDEHSFDLLRRQIRICFEHVRDDRRYDWRGERRSIDVFVVLVDDVAFAQLDRNELSQKRNAQIDSFVDIFVEPSILRNHFA